MSEFILESKGNWDVTRKLLDKMLRRDEFSDLDKYGEWGVDALSQATPVDTGLTASSWRYRIIGDARGPGIEWYNTNEEYGQPVAVLIQYGHGTGTGGYVQGYDYINPAMRPVFDKIAEEVWKKVRS
jgi:hypothetical protein